MMETKLREVVESCLLEGATSDRDLFQALKLKGVSDRQAKRLVRAKNQEMFEHYNQY
jgi:hypothetical protein